MPDSCTWSLPLHRALMSLKSDTSSSHRFRCSKGIPIINGYVSPVARLEHRADPHGARWGFNRSVGRRRSTRLLSQHRMRWSICCLQEEVGIVGLTFINGESC